MFMLFMFLFRTGDLGKLFTKIKSDIDILDQEIQNHNQNYSVLLNI